MKKVKEAKKLIGYLFIGIILIAVYKTLDNFSDIFNWIGKLIGIVMPFIIALILAYALYIPSRNLENKIKKSKFKFLKKKSRAISILIIYLVLFVFIFFVVKFVIPTVANSIKELANNLPSYYGKARQQISNLPEDSIFVKLNLKEILKNLEQINITDRILDFVDIENISQYIKGAMGVANVVFDLFVIIVISIHLLLERSKIKEFLKDFGKATFKKETYEKLAIYYSKSNRVFFSFISSQLLDAVIVGVLTSIAMLILKVKYAVLLGMLIGIFNIIPYFGAIAAVLIAGIITLLTGGISKTIVMLIVVIILQQIDANIINPKILGTSLELSPIIIIFSITLMGAYFGVLGMFLAVPIAAMVKVLILDFIEERNLEKQQENK